MRKTLLALSLLSLLAFVACGKDPLEEALEKRSAGGGGGDVSTGPALTATLKGKITFDGTPPTPKKISTSSDPGCKNANLVSEEFVVSDGGLENVILYVSGGDIAGKKVPTSKEVVTLSQEGCHYIPHALTLQVGQPLRIVNNDETAHNVHAWAEINKSFNESQSSKGVENTHVFDKEEVLLPVRCDVHNWMNSFIGVFSHPLHTVSKKGGAYEMKLPAGTYMVTAEHESLGKQEMMVTVAENGSADLNFTFKPKA
jgi:plastocyanin